jgi:DNA-binding transcriptional regulator YdaS (Cro superfamily)
MTLDAVLRRAILRAPCSTRALARTAGVSHVMLAQIVRGKEKATPRVALKVARALEEWAGRCSTEAAHVRAAVEGRTPRRDA